MILKDLIIKTSSNEEMLTKLLTLFNAYSIKPLGPSQLKMIVKIILTPTDIKSPVLGYSGKKIRESLGLTVNSFDQYKYQLRQKGYLTPEGELTEPLNKLRQSWSKDMTTVSTIFKIVVDENK